MGQEKFSWGKRDLFAVYIDTASAILTMYNSFIYLSAEMSVIVFAEINIRDSFSRFQQNIEQKVISFIQLMTWFDQEDGK